LWSAQIVHEFLRLQTRDFMSALDILNQLGDDDVAQISEQIGADQAQTRSAIQAATPLLLAGVASTAQQPQGQASVQQALDSHGGVLDDLGRIIRGGGASDVGSVLDRVLGRSKPEVQDGVQQSTGLNGDQTKRLLAILAPVVLGMLAKRRQASKTAAPIDTQLREEAEQAREQAQQRSPKIGGILGKILSYAEAPKR
jgi:hypothetical protein